MPPRSEPAPAAEAGTHVPASERLKIAFVYDALFPYQKGGAERRYHELANRLRDRHDVHYVTWKHWDGPPRIEQDGITLHGVGVPREMYGGDGKRTIREAAAFAASLGPALARQHFDVIECSATPYLPLYTCWAGSRISRTHVVATWHEFWGHHWDEYLGHRAGVARAARYLERGCVPFADTLVSVSDFTARRIPRRSHHIVENGIDFATVGPVHGWPRRGADVIYLGRLIDEKRVDVLLGAIAGLRAHNAEVRCEILGDGPDRPALQARAEALGIAGNVRFLGHVDEATLAERLAAAKVFAMPSIREGFGISVVEALARGTVPVIARSPHSAAPALIEDGVSGLVCDPEPASFAAAIGSLLGDPLRLARMSRAAVLRAAQFDWDVIAGRMELIYRDAASRPRPLGLRRGRRFPAGRGTGPMRPGEEPATRGLS